jgi:MFS family permease
MSFESRFSLLVFPQKSFQCGTFGYCLYAAALWVYDREANTGFYIAASIIMGICAGLLWAAEGAMMMAYATEETRGKYVAIFWIFFNGGGVVGGLIALGLNLTDQSSGGVSDSKLCYFLSVL